jgi:hypothetical protein
MPSERCSIEEQSIEYCGWACWVVFIGVSGQLRILCNQFFIMEKLGKGCFGSFGTRYRYFHYFLWEK